MSEGRFPAGVDPTKPSPARIYDYFLGGTENLEVDRQIAEKLFELEPDLRDGAWANRGFLQRATKWMAAEAGIEQFLDVGAGLPTRNNTHEAARKVLPHARVVYVDNDPLAVSHGKALLEGVANTTYLDGDFLDPDAVLNHPDVRELIDFSRPVGLLAAGLMHFVPDEDGPTELLRRYLDAVPTGSYLALSQGTADHQPPDKVERGKQIYAAATNRIQLRSKAEVTRFFDGLDIVPPYDGAAREVTYVSLWGAEDPEAADSDGGRLGYCGLGRKP